MAKIRTHDVNGNRVSIAENVECVSIAEINREEKHYMQCRERATTERNKLFLSIVENISTLLNEYFRDATHKEMLHIIDTNYNDMAFIINSRKSIVEREREIRENKKQLTEMENNLDLSLNY